MPSPTDNVVLNLGSGGNTVRTLADASGNEWAPAVATYATTISAGANVLQVVTPSFGLPVAQTTAANLNATVVGTGTFAVQASQTTAANLNATVVGTGTFAVQASAGTNLNTSALALESGGHLASIDTKFPSQGQALAAASVPVVMTASQLSTLTPLTTLPTVTTVTTVSAVTGITNALPAGTNLLGKISAGQQIANVYNGSTAVTPQYAAITASSSGATTVVSLASGKSIYILRWSLTANGAVNVNWQSHTTTANATGLHYMTQFSSTGGAYCPAGIFATTNGEALDINLSASVAVGGELTYVEF